MISHDLPCSQMKLLERRIEWLFAEKDRLDYDRRMALKKSAVLSVEVLEAGPGSTSNTIASFEPAGAIALLMACRWMACRWPPDGLPMAS